MKTKKLIIAMVILIAALLVLYFTTRPQISVENIDYINKTITYKMSYGFEKMSGRQKFSEIGTASPGETFVIYSKGKNFVLEIKNKGKVIKQVEVPAE